MQIKVLELYSGIGGMHLALKGIRLPVLNILLQCPSFFLESELNGEIIASVDINNKANKVYKHNFPNTVLLNKNIQGLSAEYINSLGANSILMSPPCQPFTRNGNKLDVNDKRSCSFLYLLNILPKLNIDYILIENVKGFECSKMRQTLIETLRNCNYDYQEFILSPSQFGVPNTRHRYYCLAKKIPLKFSFNNNTELLVNLET